MVIRDGDGDKGWRSGMAMAIGDAIGDGNRDGDFMCHVSPWRYKEYYLQNPLSSDDNYLFVGLRPFPLH